MEAPFVKSSFCADHTCVEASFVTSSFCTTSSCVEARFVRSTKCTSGTCVEAAAHDGMVLLRDGKDPDGTVLQLSHADWTGFLDAITVGEYSSL